MKKTEQEIHNMKAKYPNVPVHCLPTTRKRKSPANELAHQIILYVKSIGGQCYRINSQGQYDAKLGIWRKSGSTKGMSDLTAIVLGRFIGIEIKIDKDRQSEIQKKREDEIRRSGGYYMIAKDIDQVKADLQTIIDGICGQNSK